jgi:hypothetical protein
VIALAPVERFTRAKLRMKFLKEFMTHLLPGFLFVATTACTITGYALVDNQAITEAMGAVCEFVL